MEKLMRFKTTLSPIPHVIIVLIEQAFAPLRIMTGDNFPNFFIPGNSGKSHQFRITRSMSERSSRNSENILERREMRGRRNQDRPADE
jgi:hypothetical protein